MRKKVILKTLILVGLLALVIGTMNFLSSTDFKQSLQEFFTSDTQTVSWCPDHVVDFAWSDDGISARFLSTWKKASAKALKESFCTINYEDDIETATLGVKFKPLLKVQSAEAKSAVLEWSPESKLFSTQGIVFKSKKLSRELLDESR